MMKIKQFAMPADKLAYRIKKTGITHILAKKGTAEKWGDEPANVDGSLAVRANTMTPDIAVMSKCDASNPRFSVKELQTSDVLCTLGIKDDSTILAGEYEYIEVLFYDTKLIFDYATGDIFTYNSAVTMLPPLFVVTDTPRSKKDNAISIMALPHQTPLGIEVMGLCLLQVQRKAQKVYGAIREPRKGVLDFGRAVIETTYGELFAWAEAHNAKAAKVSKA